MKKLVGRVRSRRLNFYYFVLLGWVILSINNLDGTRNTGHADRDFNAWRFMAAWYVFIFGIILLSHLIVRVPSWLRAVSWASFGAGMFFWATVASSGWPLWVCTALGSWFMVVRVVRGADDD